MVEEDRMKTRDLCVLQSLLLGFLVLVLVLAAVCLFMKGNPGRRLALLGLGAVMLPAMIMLLVME